MAVVSITMTARCARFRETGQEAAAVSVFDGDFSVWRRGQRRVEVLERTRIGKEACKAYWPSCFSHSVFGLALDVLGNLCHMLVGEGGRRGRRDDLDLDNRPPLQHAAHAAIVKRYGLVPLACGSGSSVADSGKAEEEKDRGLHDADEEGRT